MRGWQDARSGIDAMAPRSLLNVKQDNALLDQSRRRPWRYPIR